jgi:hypothetical protein
LQFAISFDSADHPKSMKTMGTIPMLCTPSINNVAVTKTLIDGGAGLNVLSIETFDKLKVPYERLMPTRPFSGVTDGSILPLGQVRLPVTFGTRKNYRTELIDFDVAHSGLPYNAILGYPALAKFMTVTHHAYNTVKLPGYSDTITIRCNEKDTVRTLEHAYKTAATAHPTDEDDVEQPRRRRSRCSLRRVPRRRGCRWTAVAPGPPSPSATVSLPNKKARSSPSSGQMLMCSHGQHQICPVCRGR